MTRIENRLNQIEKRLDPETCGHVLVRYGDDGSGMERPPEPRELAPCCAVNRPILLKVVYSSEWHKTAQIEN